MHCPSCGQQQVSNETKFCSRCGLPLGLISEVVMNGGTLPQLASLNQKKPRFFNKKNGVAFSGLWCLFFLLIMAPFWGIVNVEELAGISAVVGIFGGLIWLIASLVFLPSSKQPQFAPMPQYPMPAPQPASLYGSAHSTALPPQQTQPVQSYVPGVGGWRDTSDLQPTSVVEGTTRLLNEEERR